MSMRSARLSGRAAVVSLALAAMAALVCAPAMAAVYHVSPEGSDDGVGDAGNPFRTISKATQTVQPGDRVMIAAGVYVEAVNARISGAPGRPIVFEGEKTGAGELAAIIDTSRGWQAEWVPAPEVGAGVYKTACPGFEPHSVLVEGKFIPRIWPDHMADGEGFKRMAYPADKEVEVQGRKWVVSYWDTMEAMFGCRDGTVYIRFRNGDDPGGKNLRVAPAGGGVTISNQSHIVFRNLVVRGGESCVLIRGAKATHNVIEGCRLENGARRVTIADGAAHNVIRDNEMTVAFYSKKCRTGAWGYNCPAEADVPYELRLKLHFYREYKLFFGPNSTSDCAVRVFRAGPHNEVSGNRMHGGGQGINIHDVRDVKIHHNIVYGFSSCGLICALNKIVNAQLHDNLVYDCNINIRVHHVNQPRQTAPRSLYIYRNRLYQRPDVGTHVYFHYGKKNDVPDYMHPSIFIYHNSIAGGLSGLLPSALAGDCGGLPKTMVVNNIFSTKVGLKTSRKIIAVAGMFGAVDHNWLGGGFRSADPAYDFTKAPWYGKNNILAIGARVWDDAKMPDFVLPEKSGACNAGIDLSESFVLNGRKYEPLPGMEPGYFHGERPDLGALQSP